MTPFVTGRLAALLDRWRSPASPDPLRRQITGATLLSLVAGGGFSDAALDEARPTLAGMGRGELAALLRGLVDLERRHDPALTAQAGALLKEIGEVLPEAPLLADLHRLFQPPQGPVMRPAVRIDLETLYRACAESRPVIFDYTDLAGEPSHREVLPVEIVHGRNGILLLAWCTLRAAPRKFYAHAMDNLALGHCSFAAQRPELLTAVLEEEMSARYGA